MSGAWVAKYLARHEDGPVVEATRSGDTWTLAWRGGDSIGLRGITDEAVERIVGELAERVALKVVPADQAAADARSEVAEWLRSFEEPPDDE